MVINIVVGIGLEKSIILFRFIISSEKSKIKI